MSMSSSLSALAAATLLVACTSPASSVAAAAAAAITPNSHRELQTPPSCTCTPQSYTFRLLLDNDCSSSTMNKNNLPNGTRQVTCMESAASGGSGTRSNGNGDPVRRNNKRRLLQEGDTADGIIDAVDNSMNIGYYYPAWNRGGYCHDSRTASVEEKGFETLEECCEM